jgi:hypothetical protein
VLAPLLATAPLPGFDHPSAAVGSRYSPRNSCGLGDLEGVSGLCRGFLSRDR